MFPANNEIFKNYEAKTRKSYINKVEHNYTRFDQIFINFKQKTRLCESVGHFTLKENNFT